MRILTPDQIAQIRQRAEQAHAHEDIPLLLAALADAEAARDLVRQHNLSVVRNYNSLATKLDVAESRIADAEAARQQAEHERDVERSRFAFNADRFGDLAYELERRAGTDWGHLRYQVLATLRAAVKEFRGYAAGQPSPSNWRRKAEAAESRCAALEGALREAVERFEGLLAPSVLKRWAAVLGSTHDKKETR